VKTNLEVLKLAVPDRKRLVHKFLPAEHVNFIDKELRTGHRDRRVEEVLESAAEELDTVKVRKRERAVEEMGEMQ
jgi:hypothetical protein